MNSYELISPKTGKPCGVFVCGACNRVTAEDLAEKCCQPCSCGKPARNRFECKCSDCFDREYHEKRASQLEKAELVEWDGSMIFSEEVSYHDGWFSSPEEMIDYLFDENDVDNIPEFAFLGQKVVRELDINSAIDRMVEDTYEDAEVNVSDADWKELLAAIDKFNEKYAITYYEHDFKRKVRIRKPLDVSESP